MRGVNKLSVPAPFSETSEPNLQVAEGAPLLRIRQLFYSTQAEPILYVLGMYRSDRHKLLIRRSRR